MVDAIAAVADREGGEELEYLVGEAGRARPLDGPDMGFTLFTAGIGCRSRARAGASRTVCDTWWAWAVTPTRTRAVAGALLGAAHGTAAIPPALARRRSRTREALETEAAELAARV